MKEIVNGFYGAATVSAGSTEKEIFVDFTVPDGTDVSAVVDGLAESIAQLFNLPVDEVVVVLGAPAKKRAETYRATVLFLDISGAGQLMMPIVTFAAVMFYRMF